MYKYAIICLTFLFIFACGNNEAEKLRAKEDTKWTALMANHDVVMPMMGTTNKVRKNLKNYLVENENLPTQSITKVNALIQDLDKADEGMMDWMNDLQQLDKLQKDKKHKEVLRYLEEQDVIIKNVGISMTNSIKKGMDFLEALEQ